MRGWVAPVLLAGLLVAACNPGPEEISYGVEECAYCRMVITDPPFAGQAVTRTGRSFKFDSVECLAAFRLRGEPPAEELHSLWIRDFERPELWLRAEQAAYLYGGSVRSPMGLALAAFAAPAAADEAQRESGGEVLIWDEVLDLVARAWYAEEAAR